MEDRDIARYGSNSNTFAIITAIYLVYVFSVRLLSGELILVMTRTFDMVLI